MEKEIMKYPIGIQNFGEIRTNGYVYVDKTSVVHRLVQDGKYYFLSRPRRFGKSLFLSTLRAYFEGKRELFEGLAIAKLEKEWKSYPVLHLDLNARDYSGVDSLLAELNRHLEVWEKTYGDEFRERATEERFLQIIKKVYDKTGKRVVILMQTPEYIYLLELKKDQSAAIALQLIEDKGYALPFTADPRHLFIIGINFNTTTRKIDDWIIR